MTSRTIWKFVIQVDDEITIEMPKGAELLHVETQRISHATAQYDLPCLWALVDPAAEREQRTFYVHGTGHPVPTDGREHIGSFMLYDGSFVGHLFQPRSRMTPPAKISFSDDLWEAVGHLRDLWRGVNGVEKIEPYSYPTGEAIWMYVYGSPTVAYPERWMGFPVVRVTVEPRRQG